MGALALLWIWKPWQSGEGEGETEVAVETSPTPSRTATSMPTATYAVAPSATPLYSPTPPPTATLPPDTTRHTVKSGETVSTIAKLYGTTTRAILQANGLKTNTIISIDQELLIPLPAANTSTPTPTLTPSPTPFVYTIKTGDTLSAIAKKYNTTVEALMEANNIADATNIQVGTKLTIVQPPDFTLTMAYETYEVEQGDTLYTISGEYGLTIAEIKEINNLTGNNLSVGQQLRIPVGTATPIPTDTPTPTLTPTPGPARPAPALLAPPQDTAFEGADRVIIMNWASVGILGEDEWYTVRVRRTGAGRPGPAGGVDQGDFVATAGRALHRGSDRAATLSLAGQRHAADRRRRGWRLDRRADQSSGRGANLYLEIAYRIVEWRGNEHWQDHRLHPGGNHHLLWRDMAAVCL